ncbi:hypothetical protein [Streptosporangium sp. NBC_01756]|nr:hypothetical protein [Streptosporangium sp. NBC_01756]WSC90028.1 hypothetical protein OIE48_18150 [Streptosporangium sp. NBC_01756]
MSREADRFAAAGLTKERRHGNLRLIRADTDSSSRNHSPICWP